jgi:hypothetical protein
VALLMHCDVLLFVVETGGPFELRKVAEVK